LKLIKSTGNSTNDFIMEEDGNLFYVVGAGQKKHKNLSAPQLTSLVEINLHTFDSERYSKSRDLSHLRIFTFLVINTGYNPVICQSEISPDGIAWDSCGESEFTISPGKMQVIVPQYFLRFARIKYKNKNTGFNSVITIWFQGQN